MSTNTDDVKMTHQAIAVANAVITAQGQDHRRVGHYVLIEIAEHLQRMGLDAYPVSHYCELDTYSSSTQFKLHALRVEDGLFDLHGNTTWDEMLKFEYLAAVEAGKNKANRYQLKGEEFRPAQDARLDISAKYMNPEGIFKTLNQVKIGLIDLQVQHIDQITSQPQSLSNKARL